MNEQLNALLDQLSDAQDAVLGMDPERTMLHINSAVWLGEDMRLRLAEELPPVDDDSAIPEPADRWQTKPFGGTLREITINDRRNTATGYLYDDPNHRFPRGAMVHTSPIVSYSEQWLETENSLYWVEE